MTKRKRTNNNLKNKIQKFEQVSCPVCIQSAMLSIINTGKGRTNYIFSIYFFTEKAQRHTEIFVNSTAATTTVKKDKRLLY